MRYPGLVLVRLHQPRCPRVSLDFRHHDDFLVFISSSSSSYSSSLFFHTAASSARARRGRCTQRGTERERETVINKAPFNELFETILHIYTHTHTCHSFVGAPRCKHACCTVLYYGTWHNRRRRVTGGGLSTADAREPTD